MLGWWAFAILMAIADQFSKDWIQHQIIVGDRLKITDFFNLVVAYNKGAAFSFLADAGGWQRPLLAAIAVAACIVISLIIARKSHQRWLCFGLALVMAGALGNVWDRLTLGVVVDFLDFHWGSYHWPAFNLADICICVGAFIVLIVEFFGVKK